MPFRAGGHKRGWCGYCRYPSTIQDSCAGPSGGGRFAGERINLYGSGQGFYFAHLSKLAPGIQQGADVEKGQLLGYTGEANGVQHLHFGVEHGSPYHYYNRS